MKVLFVNNCYPFGSTGNIVRSLENGCQECGCDTVVIYGRGDRSNGNHIRIATSLYSKFQALRSRITGIMYGGCILSTRKAICIIKQEKPDVVHLHCLNSNFINIFKIVLWLNKHRVKTIITNHAEFYYTANCGHAIDCKGYYTGCGNCPRLKKVTKSWFIDGTHRSWLRMKQAFDGFDSLVVVNVSPWLNQRSVNSRILSGFKNVTVLNGVDTSIFYCRSNQLSSRIKTVFHATANFSDNPHDLKGGRYFIDLAKRFEGQNIRFVVAGRYELITSIPSNVVLLGNVRDQNRLAELYSSADLVVITSQRETFSMITAESLCCGTPVIGFKAGGPESIAIPEYSEFVDYGDMEALAATTQRFLNLTFDKKVISAAAQHLYSKELMVRNYMRIYQECVNQLEY